MQLENLVKYSIESLGHVKRNRWFINKEFGISVNYYWQDETAQATFETSLIEEGCEDEWSDLVNSIENVETEEEKESLEIEIDYPAPWYFLEPERAATWKLPKPKKTLSVNFNIVISANYVFDKATELQNANEINYWSSMNDEFLWDVEGEKPAPAQISAEFEKIAKVFNSGAWHSEDELNKFMHEEFCMEIEDDVITFYSPNISEN